MMKFSFRLIIWIIALGFSNQTIGQHKYTVNVVMPDPVQNPEITSVSVNSNNKIQINWDIQADENIQYFNIYRDGTNNSETWNYIGKSPYPGQMTYTDINTFPEIRSYRYKVAAVDGCGNEIYCTKSPGSIRLVLSDIDENTCQLAWNSYLGNTVSHYQIFRGDSPEDMNLITKTESTTTSYTDTNITDKMSYYQIEAVVPFEKSSGSDQTRKLSNKVTFIRVLTSTDSLNAQKIKVYPNPIVATAAVIFPYEPFSVCTLSVIDLTGQTVYSQPVFSGGIEFERRNLRDGVYILQVRGKKTFRKKIIIGDVK